MTCMCGSLVQVGVRQQREETRALDRHRQLALEARRRARDAGRDDLAVLVDEILQHVDFLVVDPLHLVRSEAAELAAPEQRLLPAILLVLALALALAFATSESHLRCS